MRLVIDTNLWISFIISNRFSEIDNLLYTRQAKLLFSAELIQEIQATLAKPKLIKYSTPDALVIMLSAFDEYIEFINVKSYVEIGRDPDDDFLLSLAIDGKASFLITGDNDLLELKTINKCRIITMADFLKLK